MIGIDYKDILYSFIRRTQLKEILELGCGPGGSGEAFLKAIGGGGHLWSIDIQPCLAAHKRLKEFDSNWTFIQSDSLLVEWDKKVDLLYIDSDHSYSHVIYELDMFSPYTRYWILLHDTNICPGVNEAIEEFLSTSENQWVRGNFDQTGREGLAFLMRMGGDG